MPEITLTYVCGCRDTWSVLGEVASDLVDLRCKAPCVPESCQTCVALGQSCPVRASMTGLHTYTPIIWSEINGGPKRVTRMPHTGSKEWEKSA